MEGFVNGADLNERFRKCRNDDVDEVELINTLLLDKLDIKRMKNAKVAPIKDITTKSVEVPTKVETLTPEPVDEKYIIVMDVETNGLIKERGIRPTLNNLNKIPRMVQSSWGLYTETGKCKEIEDFVIGPDGWKMHGSDKLHGVTQERATAEGVDIVDVLIQ